VLAQALTQPFVVEGSDRSPGSVGGLQSADVGGGAEQEAEVEVLVGGLVLGGVASMGWMSMWGFFCRTDKPGPSNAPD
jgi:hypothetical protein